MLWWLFHAFIIGHIVFGAVGLVSFWPPVVGRKGAPVHRKWGRVFTTCLLWTGSFAIGISLCTLADPLGTHPHLKDAVFVRGIFGVMMLYLAILTVNLAWYGLQCVRNKRDHAANRRGANLILQPVLFVAALACAVEGWLIGQPLMIGMSLVGFATVATNLAFMLTANPGPRGGNLGLHGVLRLWRRAAHARDRAQPGPLGGAAGGGAVDHHLPSGQDPPELVAAGAAGRSAVMTAAQAG